MVILGIDPGTLCGWAVARSGEVLDSGTWSLKGGRYEGGGMRFLRFRRYLAEVLDAAMPDAVCFEEVRRHMGTDAAHIYGGIVAVLTSECEERGIPYKGIPVGTVKKFATGKGNANKDRMLEATRNRWPEFSGDDNEADARWIALAGSGVTA
jgi:Holliday junction resolvasome RuvABC endonuclease subunit